MLPYGEPNLCLHTQEKHKLTHIRESIPLLAGNSIQTLCSYVATLLIYTPTAIQRCPVGEDFRIISGRINMCIRVLTRCRFENIRRLSNKGDTHTHTHTQIHTHNLKCLTQCSVACIYQRLNNRSRADSIFLGAELWITWSPSTFSNICFPP